MTIKLLFNLQAFLIFIKVYYILLLLILLWEVTDLLLYTSEWPEPGKDFNALLGFGGVQILQLF